jgi:hypothetical protein
LAVPTPPGPVWEKPNWGRMQATHISRNEILRDLMLKPGLGRKEIFIKPQSNKRF